MLPVIGLTGGVRDEGGFHNVTLGEPYLRAIEMAGGYPVALLPCEAGAAVETALASVNGVLFSGGPDLSAASYGGSEHPALSPLDPIREAWDLALMRRALA